MPTKKPRINVTLDQRCYDILKSISATSGKPMSGFVAEMLEAATPTLERMAVTFQKIKNAQDSERSKFLDSMDDAQAALEPVVMQSLGQFDLFLTKVDEAADAVSGKGGPRARGDSLPDTGAVPSPRTNRGVTPIRGKQPQPAPSKALKAVSKKEVLKKTAVANEHKPRGKSHAV